MTTITGPNFITLIAQDDSSITDVNLYPSRAEVTRVFQFDIESGHNVVKITQLPLFADTDNVRVEGRGPATIHEVSVDTLPAPGWGSATTTNTTSPTLDALREKQAGIEAAIERCEKSMRALKHYIKSVKADKVGTKQIGEVLRAYESEGGKLYDTMVELKKSRDAVASEITIEQKSLNPDVVEIDPKLRTVLVVNLHGHSKEKVELSITYVVSDASWSAAYDIRADVAEEDPTIKLTYRAIITQDTGEEWKGILLSLETATPTYGLNIPNLYPWSLNEYQPVHYAPRSMSPHYAPTSPAFSPTSPGYSPASPTFSPTSPSYVPMSHRPVQADSPGNVTATFKIPGLSDIPSDRAAHSVIIAELDLKSSMSWICVPKKDSRVHLKAKITNSSDYTLLSGSASVYVNGSFIAKSNVPLVSPEENFECSLGLDSTIRVTYHPQTKKTSQTGFYSKSSTRLFTQRLSIFNSKQITISNLRILDHFPVSQHQDIVVKLISPPLTLPETLNNGTIRVPNPPKISDGVIAQWNGVDEDGVDLESLGKDGMFNWICKIPAQGKLNLTLQWEVRSPATMKIQGL
ncbi:hypothetical protein AX16_006096 [Volvariella volvacea WC 439]|nr:hypothetical protein AX16_006096 [Volvariella volvacea WC 439]